MTSKNVKSDLPEGYTETINFTELGVAFEVAKTMTSDEGAAAILAATVLLLEQLTGLNDAVDRLSWTPEERVAQDIYERNSL